MYVVTVDRRPVAFRTEDEALKAALVASNGTREDVDVFGGPGERVIAIFRDGQRIR